MAPRWLARLVRANRRASRWAKTVEAVALAVAAVLGVIFLLVPRLKPAEPCKGQERRGTLSHVVVDKSVTYGGYLTLIHEPTHGLSPKRLRQVGKLISVRIEAVGYKGKRLPIRWTTLSASGEPVTEPRLKDQLAFEVEPEECSDSGRRSVWAQNPAQPGAYQVELTLFDEDDEPLDAARSGIFRILP
jgi:hypothetical protein